MITLAQFRDIERQLRVEGYGDAIDWSEALAPPTNADAFAEAAVYVIVNSGMRYTVAANIFTRCMAALRDGGSANTAFGHPGKAAAIDRIWRERQALFDGLRATADPLAYVAALRGNSREHLHHRLRRGGRGKSQMRITDQEKTIRVACQQVTVTAEQLEERHRSARGTARHRGRGHHRQLRA